MDIHALHRQGMTITEIARRTNHDRKTIRAYLTGKRAPGQRRSTGPDSFEGFVDYVTARFVEDPHLWAMTLFDELTALGFRSSIRPSPGRFVPGICGRPARRARMSRPARTR